MLETAGPVGPASTGPDGALFDLGRATSKSLRFVAGTGLSFRTSPLSSLGWTAGNATAWNSAGFCFAVAAADAPARRRSSAAVAASPKYFGRETAPGFPRRPAFADFFLLLIPFPSGRYLSTSLVVTPRARISGRSVGTRALCNNPNLVDSRRICANRTP
jgi:hypothetical protein